MTTEYTNSNNANDFNDFSDYDTAEINNDKFARLKAIAEGRELPPNTSSELIHWNHIPHQPLIGTIRGFDEFEHPQFGRQETVIVERENGEMVSAILTEYLQKGMMIQNGEIGDDVLILKQNQERSKNGKIFNRFLMVIDKN
jgi:hypothetical protein